MRFLVKSKQKIGIIGVGTVGNALAKALPEALLYDKYKNIGNLKDINKANIIFLCVPTPHDKKIGFDSSAIENAFSILKGKKIIVIKSTVLPGTTEKMQNNYPQHKVLFNPEFLCEISAEKDTLYPDRQIIGYTKKSRDVAKGILKILPKAPFERIILAREAEMVKYFGNAFLVTKVIFANQIYDLCQKLNIDYELVKECTVADPRINPSHLDIFYEGYRGYGKKCLPKDIKSIIQLGNKLGVNLELLKTAEKINKLLKKQEGQKKLNTEKHSY